MKKLLLAVGYGSKQVERLLDEKYSGKIKLQMRTPQAKALRRLLEQQCAMKQKFLPWNVTVYAPTLLMKIIKVHLSHDTFCTALTYDTENKPACIYSEKRAF